MPQGKGTYGKKVGRPRKKKEEGKSLLNNDRQQYAEGTGDDKKDPTTKKVRVGGTADLANVDKGRGTAPEVVSFGSRTNPNSILKHAGSKSLQQQPSDMLSPTLLEIDHRTTGDKLIEATGTAFNTTANLLSKINQTRNSPIGRVAHAALNPAGFAKEEILSRLAAPGVEYVKRNYAEGGDVNDQMDGLAISVAPIAVEETHTMPDGTEMAGATHEEYEEQTMLPDEEMEEDYVDYVMEETLSNEDRNYLISALEQDDRLSQIFDQVVESATEFSGSGPIEGPGSEKSDSIPARLSDGEFVFTAKATEEIGSDNLMSMMEDAEAAAEQRQGVAYGGMIDEEDGAIPIQTRGSLAALGRIPNVVKQSRQVEEEMLKSSPRRYYVPVSG